MRWKRLKGSATWFAQGGEWFIVREWYRPWPLYFVYAKSIPSRDYEKFAGGFFTKRGAMRWAEEEDSLLWR